MVWLGTVEIGIAGDPQADGLRILGPARIIVLDGGETLLDLAQFSGVNRAVQCLRPDEGLIEKPRPRCDTAEYADTRSNCHDKPCPE
jgi:hypothetical protein